MNQNLALDNSLDFENEHSKYFESKEDFEWTKERVRQNIEDNWYIDHVDELWHQGGLTDAQYREAQEGSFEEVKKMGPKEIDEHYCNQIIGIGTEDQYELAYGN